MSSWEFSNAEMSWSNSETLNDFVDLLLYDFGFTYKTQLFES
jgi:hypothetical protein